MKKTKKIVSSILLLCILISNLSSVFAVSIGDTAEIVNRGDCGTYLTYKRNGVTMVVDTHYVGFYENGTFHPAYCLNHDLPGVDDERHYGVVVEDMSSIANNQAVWRVLVNGFPYKTPQEMGLESEEQAFMVTKQAVYRVLDGESTDNYGGLNATGQLMVNKIKELVNIGLNGTQTYQDPVINVSKLNNAGIDNINKDYISQTFQINSQVDMENITALINRQSAPEGTFIADENNNAKTQLSKGERFKVLVPRKNISSNMSVQISFNGNCKVYPILYGKAPSDNLQNYLITSDPYVMSAARITMDYTPSYDVEVEKVSNGISELTGKVEGDKLANATFRVKLEDGSLDKEIKTDENGKFVLENLPINVKLTVTEISAPDYFIKGKDTTVIIEGKYDGDNQKVTIENTPVKIEVNVDKTVDKTEAQGNEIVEYSIDNIKNLSNVKLNNFALTDDLPKEVRIQKLETGTYNEDLKYDITYNTNKNTNIKLKEGLSTKTNNSIDFTQIKLANGEYITSYTLNFGTVNIGFSNTTKIKVDAKVVEGLADKSSFTNNVKVSGTYLEKKTEDKDDVDVKVYENILKIKKVSKEYNQYTDLQAGTRINAVFELLDENKNYIDTLKIDNANEFIYKYLETGKTFYLKEISTDPYYVINKELTEFRFDTNGQVVELTIENDNVNLVVDVEKEGPTEAQKGEVITYEFNNIGNFSNTEVNEFIWGDKLPRQVSIQKLETGTWNEELTYKVQYITNRNTNWTDLGEFNTDTNNTIDFTTLELADGEYVKEYRLCFGKVKEGFTQIESPKTFAKVNEDVQNNKIFVNNTYVTASYEKTKLEAKDEAHTVVYTKTPVEDIDKELPKTGLDY